VIAESQGDTDTATQMYLKVPRRTRRTSTPPPACSASGPSRACRRGHQAVPSASAAPGATAARGVNGP
jgi:hypothetical protein